MSRWWGPAAALVAMFFTVDALYTLHQETTSFDGALSACRPDGSLTSMASEEEKEHILSSVSASLKSAGAFEFWVGLWKPAGTCNRDDLPLRGFVWTSDNSSASEVSRWSRAPVGTCTSERCGLLSLNFDGEKVTDWGWAGSGCSRPHGFICKSTPGGTSPPDLADHRPSTPPRPHTVLPSPPPSLPPSPEKERIPPTLSPGSSVTSSSSVIKEIQESTADKYSIFIPVLVALLVLVVLVVVVLVILKCCFKKRPKKEAPQTKNGGKAELTVDLTDTDLDQAETTA